jgi:hypothetical protein
VSHRESYELLTNADPSFCSRLGHIIDMAEQAFLCSCITASTTAKIDVSVLDHSALRTGISMGMMPAVAIPLGLATILIADHPTCHRPPAGTGDEPLQKRLKSAAREREEPEQAKDKKRRPGSSS